MADKSKIEWTEATWNPIRGCSVVSEGCRNCYAMQVAARFSGDGHPYEGLAYRNGSGAHWTGKVKFVEEHLEDPLRWKRPRRIFVNSMSDLFHESIPDEWIDQIFAVMRRASQHVFQVLTKRPGRALRYLAVATSGGKAAEMRVRKLAPANTPQHWYHATNWQWSLPNVHMGVSCEDQKTADERIPLLLETPAALRWVSAEPLLGPIDFRHDTELGPMTWLKRYELGSEVADRIDWVVVGGESGPGARPMHPDWAKSLRDQCVKAGVPFFFKQWGEFASYTHGPVHADELSRQELVTIDIDGRRLEWEDDDRRASLMVRVGKKAAGRLLAGREWNEYPEQATAARA